MAEKKRIFYLDFIRAIAVISILLTHYNAIFVYMWDESALKKVVLTWKVANLYIGDFGVSLFFIISGAALMSVYSKKLEIKTFYLKRFWNIYPMFWIAYLAAFLYSFWVNRGIDPAIPKRNMLLSVIGMDGYLSGVVPTFYQVGEWFLGFIIIFYLIFPLLKMGVDKRPVLTAVVIGGMYVILNLYYPFTFNKSIFLLTRLPEICFGMYFVKYIKKTNGWMAILSLIVFVFNTIAQPSIDKDIQTTYVGIASFILLSFIAGFINASFIKKICFILSKYSYAIFLVHHYIITVVTSKFDLYNISVVQSYLLFILCCCIIALFSKGLYELNEYCLKQTKLRKKKC